MQNKKEVFFQKISFGIRDFPRMFFSATPYCYPFHGRKNLKCVRCETNCARFHRKQFINGNKMDFRIDKRSR